MRTLKRAVFIMILLGAMFAQGVSQCVRAEERFEKPVEYNGELVSKNYYFDRDITFKEVFGGDRIYFTVDDHWKVQKAVLNLSLTSSELLDEGMSTLTVYINDKPAHSMRLAGEEDRKNNIALNIPVEYLKKGINELRIDVYSRISEKPCVDDVNNGNWVLIHSTSYVHLEFNEEKAVNLISEFPYPFLKASDSASTGKSLILLPDNPDGEEMSAALQVASALGSIAKGVDIDLNTSTYSQTNEKDRQNRDIIFIGKLKKLPKEIMEKTPREVSEKAGEGVLIYTIDSPYNEGKKLMCLVTDRDDGMLDTAAKLLQNTDVTAQIENNVCFIEKGADIKIREKENQDHVTLKDLGYQGGIYMKGPFRQQATIGVKLPKNRQVLPGAKINLHIRYSKNLDFVRSLATVSINGTPIGSKKLEMSAADGDSIEVTIPSDLKIGSYIEIKVAFDLEVPDMKCIFRQEEMPWGFIAEDSSLTIPTRDENAFLFENYPWPFIKDGKFNNVTVVLPDPLPAPELDMLFDLFAHMGKELNANTGILRVVKDSAFIDQYKDSNIIMMGAPEELKFLKTINNSLWFKYNDSFSFFVSNEKRRLMEDFSRNLASIQLFASPLNKSRGMMAITSPKKENMVNLGKYLTESKFSGSLVGNASLVDRWGNITNHYFIREDSSKPSAFEKIQLGGTQIKIFIILFATVLLLLAISLIMYTRKHKRK